MKHFIVTLLMSAFLSCSGTNTPDGDADGEADADSDVDSDSDGDTGGDADVDGDLDDDFDSLCERDCAAEPLRSQCEVGDCTHSGLPRECCVSDEPICHTTANIGELFAELEVTYRGLYDNDLLCGLRLVESRDDSMLSYSLQTRGTSVMPFIQLELDVSTDEVEADTTYALCDEGASPRFGLDVEIYTSLDTEPSRYENIDCETAGTIVFTELGDETGAAYAFELSGTLPGFDDSGDPNGETLELELTSEGVLEVTE